jgi:DNA-3-methyladenine glycosylase
VIVPTFTMLPMEFDPYPRVFFERSPDAVARELIGSQIVVRRRGHSVNALIVETEAYGGSDDPASHSYRGPTPRNEVMFGPSGVLYVYRSYGIHWCVNVVTAKAGSPSAVLLRGAAIVVESRKVADSGSQDVLLRGPGNLSRGLGITGADNHRDCCHTPPGSITFCAGPHKIAAKQIGQSRRIGLTKGVERASRYFLIGHRAVSGSRVQNAPSP